LESGNTKHVNQCNRYRSDTFDFKGSDYNELCNHIYAMANASGASIVLGIEKIPSASNPQIIIQFKKNGF
jgi:hypothetical protein